LMGSYTPVLGGTTACRCTHQTTESMSTQATLTEAAQSASS
jgi:hypothetical protein